MHGTYRLNRHTRTMKSKRKQDILSLMTFKLSTKDCFSERECMSNVQVAIAVWIRKRDEKRLFVIRWISVGFKGIFALPHGLHFHFICTKCIAFGSTLWCVYRKGRHGVRRWSISTAHGRFFCWWQQSRSCSFAARRELDDIQTFSQAL